MQSPGHSTQTAVSALLRSRAPPTNVAHELASGAPLRFRGLHAKPATPHCCRTAATIVRRSNCPCEPVLTRCRHRLPVAMERCLSRRCAAVPQRSERLGSGGSDSQVVAREHTSSDEDPCCMLAWQVFRGAAAPACLLVLKGGATDLEPSQQFAPKASPRRQFAPGAASIPALARNLHVRYLKVHDMTFNLRSRQVGDRFTGGAGSPGRT